MLKKIVASPHTRGTAPSAPLTSALNPSSRVDSHANEISADSSALEISINEINKFLHSPHVNHKLWSHSLGVLITRGPSVTLAKWRTWPYGVLFKKRLQHHARRICPLVFFVYVCDRSKTLRAEGAHASSLKRGATLLSESVSLSLLLFLLTVCAPSNLGAWFLGRTSSCKTHHRVTCWDHVLCTNYRMTHEQKWANAIFSAKFDVRTNLSSYNYITAGAWFKTFLGNRKNWWISKSLSLLKKYMEIYIINSKWHWTSLGLSAHISKVFTMRKTPLKNKHFTFYC